MWFVPCSVTQGGGRSCVVCSAILWRAMLFCEMAHAVLGWAQCLYRVLHVVVNGGEGGVWALHYRKRMSISRCNMVEDDTSARLVARVRPDQLME